MNLKQNFINSLKTLLVNDPECDLIENYETENCNNKKKNWSKCHNDCSDCSFNEVVIVDLALMGCSEGTEYYYYFKGTKNNKCIGTYMSSYKRMHKELHYLNTYVIGQEQKEDLEYYKKVDELRQYSNQFFEDLCDKYFPLLDSNILPIKFHRFALNFDEYKKERQTGGRLSIDGRQNVIDIYHANLSDAETLKSNLRHEIIHYALYCNDCSCTDDSGIFHALCKIYDAGAYAPMNDYEQNVYDLFFAYQSTGKHELKCIVNALGGLDKTIVEERNKLIDEIEVEKERRRLKEVV